MADSIVVGTDGSESAQKAVDEAVRLARALAAEIHVVSAFEPLRGAKIAGAPEAAAKVWAPLPDSHVDATLQAAEAAIRLAGVNVTPHAVKGDPADALIEIADKVDASMIVVGSKGMHGARRLVLGNVPNKVSHHAHRTVLIVATDSD
jgi:nucleotide-binding universal stress UspA family protein